MKTFLISDLHLNHTNILTFKRNDGTPLRNFKDIEEMNLTLLYNWNKVVCNSDKVYVLGDLSMGSDLSLFKLMNGTKVLIKGNHDNLKLNKYVEHFKDVRSYHVLDKFILSHIPIHPESFSRWRANIHGHTHANNLTDTRYYNVSVENINYTPIDFEKIRAYYNQLDKENE
ncbi:MAG TPA: metallophosphoesterase family protein [Chitinophagaceae bacterium]|nr:metallophosphoesterase family protein [Chitinophagaceae bacterium]